MIDQTNLAASRFGAAKRASAALFLLVVACAAVWYSRETLLRRLAELWVVSDTVGPADAIVIFGGGLEVRPFAAAAYYQKGLAKKILVSNVRVGKAETVGGMPSHTEWNRRVLLKLGVPEAAIETFGVSLSNSYQEAVALREWAISNHAHSIIVPTEQFPSRRVRWVVRHELAGAGIQVEVPALTGMGYSVSDWWRDEKGVVEFQNEVLKYVYYRFKY